MSGIVELFGEFQQWAVAKIPALVKANRDLREDMRRVVGEIADELRRGLLLVELRLEGARNLRDAEQLRGYLLASQDELMKAHSEFKVCAGLRDVRDRFKRIFDPTKLAVEDIRQVSSLLYELEKNERLIMDETGTLWANLRTAARNVGTPAGDEDLKKLIDREILLLHERQDRIKGIARDIVDVM